jgi:hypothetical protein
MSNEEETVVKEENTLRFFAHPLCALRLKKAGSNKQEAFVKE